MIKTLFEFRLSIINNQLFKYKTSLIFKLAYLRIYILKMYFKFKYNQFLVIFNIRKKI